MFKGDFFLALTVHDLSGNTVTGKDVTLSTFRTENGNVKS